MSEFTSAILVKTVFGDQRTHMGTWFASGCTGGPIATGLNKINLLTPFIYQTGTTHNSGAVSVSGAIPFPHPISGGNIEVTCSLNTSGSWIAYGK